MVVAGKAAILAAEVLVFVVMVISFISAAGPSRGFMRSKGTGPASRRVIPRAKRAQRGKLHGAEGEGSVAG